VGVGFLLVSEWWLEVFFNLVNEYLGPGSSPGDELKQVTNITQEINGCLKA
jgi:hypothetical protein